MTRSVQVFAYVRPSALESAGSGRLLGLEAARGLTPRGAEARPRFSSRFLASPQAAARGLLAVADVAAARYDGRTRPGSPDPVVTGNGDRLRFESFSGRGGVYARPDVLEEGLGGAGTGHRTTHVDVNDPLREALPRMSGGDPTRPRVGPGELAVTTLAGTAVEKEVPLPDRWLRGFAEAQAASARFDLRAELTGAEAVRFLRSLPRGGGRGRGPLWVARSGRTPWPTTRPGTAGRVGYDLADAARFHRELPYDAVRAERHNPRLVSARRLVAAGAVELDGPRATVVSGERRHRVRESAGALGRACRWWADHQGRRGPCEHALAVRTVRRGAAADGPVPAPPTTGGTSRADRAVRADGTDRAVRADRAVR